MSCLLPILTSLPPAKEHPTPLPSVSIEQEIGVGSSFLVWTPDKKRKKKLPGIGPQTLGCLTHSVGLANMIPVMLAVVNRHVACRNPEHSAVHRKT